MIFPTFTGGVGIAFIHRIAGFILVLLVIVIYLLLYRYYRNIRELMMLGSMSVALILFQVFSGATLMFTMDNPEVYMFVVLAHVTSIAVLFGLLSYMSYLVWRLSKPV